jgi:VCBS repeat-containing protein
LNLVEKEFEAYLLNFVQKNIPAYLIVLDYFSKRSDYDSQGKIFVITVQWPYYYSLNKCQEDQSLIEENQNEILFTVTLLDDGNSHVGTISVSGFALKKKLPLRGRAVKSFPNTGPFLRGVIVH